MQCGSSTIVRSIRLVVLATLLLSSRALAQPELTAEFVMPAEVNAVAVQALATLQMLVTSQNAAKMGFLSKEEAATARLAVPLRVVLVRLDELRAYSPGADPITLLHPLDRIILPAAVSGEVKSSISIEKSGGKWAATRFGAPKLVKLLSAAREASVAAGAASPGHCVAVYFGGLNQHFIGFVASGTLLLTPVQDDAALGFVAGQPLPATVVFAKLAPVARHYNGLPM
jgi:hypothetical protein